jgi:hypothetical protein
MPGALGTSSTLRNEQCSIALASSSAVPNGNTLTLTLAMSFDASFAGSKNVFLYADSVGGTSSGWHDRGNWAVPSITTMVTADSVAPDHGNGNAQPFLLQYSNTAGAGDFVYAWVWFSESFGAAAGSCMIYYEPSADTIYLLNDAGTTRMRAAMASGVMLQNGQCGIDVSAATVTIGADTLTLNIPMTFTPAFAGVKNVYMYGAGAGGTSSGWQSRGVWTVPAMTSSILR